MRGSYVAVRGSYVAVRGSYVAVRGSYPCRAREPLVQASLSSPRAPAKRPAEAGCRVAARRVQTIFFPIIALGF